MAGSSGNHTTKESVSQPKKSDHSTERQSSVKLSSSSSTSSSDTSSSNTDNSTSSSNASSTNNGQTDKSTVDNNGHNAKAQTDNTDKSATQNTGRQIGESVVGSQIPVTLSDGSNVVVTRDSPTTGHYVDVYGTTHYITYTMNN